MNEVSQQVSDTEAPSRIGGGWTIPIVVSFLGMVLVQEYTSLGYTSISIALPEISAYFSTTQGGWLLTAFMLTGAVVSPLLGKMADIFGKRKILLMALAIAALGGVVAALAPNMGILILGRCLEGFAVSGMFLSYSLMRDIFPKKILPLAISLCLTGTGVFTALIPLLVGTLLDRFGFRGLFWFDVVVLCSLLVIILFSTPESPLRTPATVDFRGGLLLGGGVALVLIGISQGQAWGWSSMGVIGCVVAGFALLAAFVLWSQKQSDPIVDLSIFTARSLLMIALVGGLVFGSFTLATTMMPMISMADPGDGFGLGLSATEFSAIGTPMFLCVTLGGFIVGKTVARLGGRRWLAIGCVLMITCGLYLTVFNDTYVQILIAALIAGLGSGVSMATLPNLVVQYAPASDQGSIAGSVQVVTSSMSSITPVLMFAILAGTATATPDGPVYSESGYQGAALLMVLLAAVALTLLFTVFATRNLKAPVRVPSEATN